MKVLEKKQIFMKKMTENVMLEKYILKESDSPFVVKLNSCFQTVSKVFIVMEYMEGGDLLRLLKKYNTFPEEWTVFLAAEIVLGLEYLHEKMNVIYRDLKPENIMLTRSGHIKLIDFGLSKYLKTNQKAQTFAGTPEYLAPEMFLKKGHNKAVDLWSLGIIIFQMLIGRTPFKVCKKNINKLKSQIIENRPDIPAELSHNARDLICKLLQTNPECRLGVNGFQEIKYHPFFTRLDWSHVYNMSLESPFTNLKQVEDIQIKSQNYIEISDHSVNHQLVPNIFGISYHRDPITDTN